MTTSNEIEECNRNGPVQIITEEMVEAGIRSYLSWDHQEDLPDEIVTEIFRVMAALSPQAR